MFLPQLLEIRRVGTSGGRFYPCARNKKRKQVWETVSPLRKKYKPQEHPVDVFSLALETLEAE